MTTSQGIISINGKTIIDLMQVPKKFDLSAIMSVDYSFDRDAFQIKLYSPFFPKVNDAALIPHYLPEFKCLCKECNRPIYNWDNLENLKLIP